MRELFALIWDSGVAIVTSRSTWMNIGAGFMLPVTFWFSTTLLWWIWRGFPAPGGLYRFLQDGVSPETVMMVIGLVFTGLGLVFLIPILGVHHSRFMEVVRSNQDSVRDSFASTTGLLLAVSVINFFYGHRYWSYLVLVGAYAFLGLTLAIMSHLPKGLELSTKKQRRQSAAVGVVLIFVAPLLMYVLK